MRSMGGLIMTREEAIIEAGIEYSIQNSPYCIGGDNFYEKARELNRNKSFEAGAIWADQNPKSPWISVKDDLPCNHQELTHSNYTDRILVLSRNGYSEVAFMCIIEDVWEWNTLTTVLYWMPIPEPPK